VFLIKVSDKNQRAIHVAGVRGDPCGAVHHKGHHGIAATTPGLIVRILNSVFFKLFSNFNEVQTYSLMMIC